MQDTELYARLLSLGRGWRVREVRLDMAKSRVDVLVETVEGGEWCFFSRQMMEELRGMCKLGDGRESGRHQRA